MKLKNPFISESEMLNSILAFLKLLKIYCWRNNNVGVYDPSSKSFRRPPKHCIKGVSDILAVLPDGKLLAIEVKSIYGKVSKEQQEFINKINNNKGCAFVARSIKDVEENLQSFYKGDS